MCLILRINMPWSFYRLFVLLLVEFTIFILKFFVLSFQNLQLVRSVGLIKMMDNCRLSSGYTFH